MILNKSYICPTMSFKIQINAEELKNSFLVNDCTGIYRFDNLEGWNSPNPDIRKITKSTLSVWPPNISVTAQPFTIDLTGTFPNVDNNDVEVLPYQVGAVNNQLESGLYKIRLDIEGTDKKGNTYTEFSVINRVFINNVTCCIDKGQKIVNKDAFKDSKQQAQIEMNNFLESANYAIKCELYEQASEIIELLKSLCTCNGC